MAFDLTKWVLGKDYLKMDFETFKKTLQSKFKGIKVKEINELYKKLHGYDIDVSPEVDSDS